MAATTTLPAVSKHLLAQLITGRTAVAPWFVRDLLTLSAEVVRHQAAVLAASDWQFLAQLCHLSPGALALLVRLFSRRHAAYLLDQLNYPHIPLPQAAAQLRAAGLANAGEHLADETLLLPLTKSQLLALLPADARRGAGKLRKPDLQLFCLSHPAAVQALRQLPWLALHNCASLPRLLLLFFGNPWQDLATFVVRDLGHVRYENYPLNSSTTIFQTPAQLERACELLEWRQAARQAMAGDQPEPVAALIAPLWHQETMPWLERRRSRLLNRIGRWLERQGCWDDALTAWQRSTEAPARERTIRLLQRLGDQPQAQRLATAVLANPADDAELALARRTLDHRQARRRLYRPEVLALTAVPQADQSVEQTAAAVLASEGRVVFHTENRLPCALFALAFWDILFAPVPGAFTHPFQNAPLDLTSTDFRRDRADLVQQRLQELAECPDLGDYLRPVLAAKQGLANALVHWGALPMPALNLAMDHLHGHQLAGLCDRMSRKPGEYRRGFPDLVCFGPEPGYMEFLEVKGPNDQLQPHQRLWLRTFVDLGIPARVLRLDYGPQPT